MAKKGMKRINETHTKSRNDAPPVPEISGSAKSGKEKVKPIIAKTNTPSQKVFHSEPFSKEKPISDVYATIDTDLARDNIENDLTGADLQDL